MTMETSPLLDSLDWIRHGFFGKDNSTTNAQVGLHHFTDDFPKTLFLRQRHSSIIIGAKDDPQQDADAVITDESRIGLAIKTADCCPILVACDHSKQIAAIHAGWPGALNGIVVKTLEQMAANGADPNAIFVAIGPSIHAATYPVMDDVRDKFAAQNPEALSCFVPFEDRWLLDVRGIVKQQLGSLGITKIWESGINTFDHPGFSSYRRRHIDPENATGRNVGVIMKITP